MKTILVTLVTAVFGLVALPDTAEARSHGNSHSHHTYRSGHASCGCAVYTKRIFTGYDCYHRPTYRYYQVPVSHRCRSHYRPRSHRRHDHGRHYSRDRRRGHNSSHIHFRTRYGDLRVCR